MRHSGLLLMLLASTMLVGGSVYAAGDVAPPPPPFIDDVMDGTARNGDKATQNSHAVVLPAPDLPAVSEDVVAAPKAASKVAPVQKKANAKMASSAKKDDGVTPISDGNAVTTANDIFAKNENAQGVFTLTEALNEAYLHNPTLRAARAQVRSVAEGVAQARAGWQPTVTASGDITYRDSTVDPGADGSVTNKTATLGVVQPLYRGGATTSGTAAAKALLDAQLAALATNERAILYATATAYMDVMTAQASVRANEKNRDVIARQLKATRDRFQVGDVTRTDVAQSEYRLAQAEADVTAANGTLRSARAVFEQYVGMVQDRLTLPAPQFNFPASVDAAVTMAETYNPDVIAAQASEVAAKETVGTEFAALLPDVSLEAAQNFERDPSASIDSTDTTSIGVVASIPLYEGGATRSRVRAAKYTASERFMQVLAAKRAAREETVRAWESVATARAELVSRESQLRAAQIARNGVHAEADMGERTILDALDADQDVRDAEIALITAKRNQVVAQYALASALGLLVPGNVGIQTPVMDVDHILGGTTNPLSTHADIEAQEGR